LRFTRLRSGLHALVTIAARTDIERDDVMILLGLLLVGVGLWRIYQPLALVAIGAVLLWTFLPARPPWIERSTKPERRS
jgi:Na+-transporting methylmalonyl-CoA/oxaloacetate decarboxylase beta subunit